MREETYLILNQNWSSKKLFCNWIIFLEGFPDSSDGKESAWNTGDKGSIPGSRTSTEKEMATHSSILAWEVPWMEEPGGLGSMGLQRVRCEWTWACVHERISPALLSKSLLEFVCENITVPASFKHRLLTAGHRVLFAPYIICYDISIRTGT